MYESTEERADLKAEPHYCALILYLYREKTFTSASRIKCYEKTPTTMSLTYNTYSNLNLPER